MEKHYLLEFFGYIHLPEPLSSVSKLFYDLAYKVNELPNGSEKTASLRKLLEAKDCAVRAALPKKK